MDRNTSKRIQAAVAALIACVFVALGGFGLWFGLGPGTEIHAGMPFVASGVIGPAIGFIAATLAFRLSRSVARRDRPPTT